jgi:hypothetical protein
MAVSSAVLQPVWPDAEHVTAAGLVSDLRQVLIAAAAGATAADGATVAAASTRLGIFCLLTSACAHASDGCYKRGVVHTTLGSSDSRPALAQPACRHWMQ